MEHRLDDAKSRVANLNNEILDISYQTDLLLRFQRENRRLLHVLKGISRKAMNPNGEEAIDKELQQEWLEEEAAILCDQEKKDLKEKLEREIRGVTAKQLEGWIQQNIQYWEKDKIHRCEKERWEIFDKQREGLWSPGKN